MGCEAVLFEDARPQAAERSNATDLAWWQSSVLLRFLGDAVVAVVSSLPPGAQAESSNTKSTAYELL